MKRSVRISDVAIAQVLSGTLRMHEHVARAQVSKSRDEHVAAYAVAKSHVERLKHAGGRLHRPVES